MPFITPGAVVGPQGPAGTITAQYDVKTYGAVLDGVTDDSLAIAAAFTAMKTDGVHARGTLLIPGPCKVNSAIVLDGGYASVEPDNNDAPATRFNLVCQGPIVSPSSSVGNVLTIKGFYNPGIQVAFVNGGNSADNALHLENILGLDLWIEGDNFAGTLLHMDASSDDTKGLRISRVRHLKARYCGQAISLNSINAFGSFDYIWDDACTNGSVFTLCSDIRIGFYTNYSPATQVNGVHFDGCNNMNVGDIELGDKASAALLRVSSDSGPSDFGHIGNIRISATTAPAACVVFDELKSITVDRLQTKTAAIGLNIKGGGQNGIYVKQHFSLTGSTNPLYIEPHTNNAPIIDIGVHYRFMAGAPVKIVAGMTGWLKLRGYLGSPNGTQTYAIDAASAGMTIDYSELDGPSGYTHATNHAGTNITTRVSGLPV